MSKHESQETKKAKAELKNKKKETNTMKKVIILTVVSTLAVLAVLAGTFFAGTQYQQHQHEAITKEAESLVSQLKPESR